MKFFCYLSLLLGLFNFTDSTPLHHVKREIIQPGRKTTRGNASEIVSWTLTALSFATINTVSYKPANLTFLCENFGNLTARYKEAFPEIKNGDITDFANEVICSAAQTGTGGSPNDNVWSIRSYISAIFILQTYAGNPQPNNGTSNYYNELCWFLEDSLMSYLWMPSELTHGSSVDVEGSFCARAGRDDKGPGSTYTNETAMPSDSAIQETTVLVSRLLAKTLRVLLYSEEQASYICSNWDGDEGIGQSVRSLGLTEDVVWSVICADEGRGEHGGARIVGVEEAKREMLEAMKQLFVMQLLNSGSDGRYHGYLCRELSTEGLNTVLLDGKKIKEDVCMVANITSQHH